MIQDVFAQLVNHDCQSTEDAGVIGGWRAQCPPKEDIAVPGCMCERQECSDRPHSCLFGICFVFATDHKRLLHPSFSPLFRTIEASTVSYQNVYQHHNLRCPHHPTNPIDGHHRRPPQGTIDNSNTRPNSARGPQVGELREPPGKGRMRDGRAGSPQHRPLVRYVRCVVARGTGGRHRLDGV